MIQPGLERIALLVKDLPFPWKAIHVAGTNGKGSICAFAASLLHRRKVRVGRFTSPHLIHRWDCIHIGQKPVNESDFLRAEEATLELNQRQSIKASEFEILTATAFRLFNEQRIEVGVVEVGMGGKLDATNILNNQVVSVISKISRDHENFLGTTIEEIARHKAGILRPKVPYAVNPMNEWNIHEVIAETAKEVGAGPFIHGDSEYHQKLLWSNPDWLAFAGDKLPFQRDNMVMAYLAADRALTSLGQKHLKLKEAIAAFRDTKFPGRLQETTIPSIYGPYKAILVDGAHNEDSAQALADYLDLRDQPGRRRVRIRKEHAPPDRKPVTWVIAMSDSKDVFNILKPLIQEGDAIVTTSFGPVDGMPWVKPMDPKKILQTVQELQPDVVGISIPEGGAYRALIAAKHMAERDQQVVLTGSLYLVGTLMYEMELEERGDGSIDLVALEKEERERAQNFPHSRLILEARSTVPEEDLSAQERMKRQLTEEVERLDEELAKLESERASIYQSSDHLLREALSSEGNSRLSSSMSSSQKTLKEKFQPDIEDIRMRLDALTPKSPASRRRDS